MREVKVGDVVIYGDRGGSKEYFALVKAETYNNFLVLFYINDEGHPWEPAPVSHISNSAYDYWRHIDVPLSLDN